MPEAGGVGLNSEAPTSAAHNGLISAANKAHPCMEVLAARAGATAFEIFRCAQQKHSVRTYAERMGQQISKMR